MKTLTEKLTRHLATEDSAQNLWCLVYAMAIVAAYVFALDHVL